MDNPGQGSEVGKGGKGDPEEHPGKGRSTGQPGESGKGTRKGLDDRGTGTRPGAKSVTKGDSSRGQVDTGKERTGSGGGQREDGEVS
jgi:hypothetical protein